eukprot:Nitzschia sp. Nitz4//scaffold28_size193895//53989//55077//NITZ4_001642-RA/size193895-augustus-gene-0.304-mRNA-1//-1//CDS//3329545913//1167//frame0
MSSEVQAFRTAMQVKSALSSIGSPPTEGTKVKGEDTDSLITDMKGHWLYLVALAGLVSAVLSFVLIMSHVVDFSSITLMVLAPLAVYQKTKLDKLGSLREQQNELRHSVNEFSRENDALTKNVDELTANVDELHSVATEWKDAVERSGGQVERLVQIVQANGEIQTKIKQNLEVQVMQRVLSFALQTDKNSDFNFSGSELKRLKLSLSNIPGVTFDKDNFDKFVGNRDISLQEIMKLLRNLKADIPDKDNIFHITPEKMNKRGLFG